MTRNEARQYRRNINAVIEPLADETALDVTDLFEPWQTGKDYTIDKRVQYEGKLYRCVQWHTAQEGWEPDKVPALWTEVAKPGEIPVWKQPTGAQDAYMTGDRVHYPDENGPVYVSTVDNNVWEPGQPGSEALWRTE